MAYQALYRRMRPKTFGDVVGQETVVRTLRNQVKLGQISHAYLFCGTRGTGKTTIAQIFSRAINCLNPVDGDACGVCPSCESLLREGSMDVVEIDAASNNGVDEIRDLREKVKYPPQVGNYRVYIVDEVHMLSSGAFNAFLKTLEEPPGHAVFILCTTEPQRLPATILSRCQRYDFKRIPQAQIVGHLRKIVEDLGAGASEEALIYIARSAQGAMRDALGALDQCLTLGENDVTLDIAYAAMGSAPGEVRMGFVNALCDGDAPTALERLNDVANSGQDMQVFSRDVQEHIRELLIAAVHPNCADMLAIDEKTAANYRQTAQKAGSERLLHMLSLFSEVEPQMRWATSPQVLMEMAALRACMPSLSNGVEALAARVAQLEQGLAQGDFTPKPALTKGHEGEAPAAKPQPKKMVPKPAPAPSEEKVKNNDAGSIWQAALEYVRKNDMALFMPLRQAQLLRIEGGAAHINFPSEVFLKMAQKPEKQATIEAALKEAAGEVLSCAFSAGQTQATQIDAGDDILKRAADLFGRENIIVED